MLLRNSFTVPLTVEGTWSLLTDLPKIAPCLPGAHLDSAADGQYHGGLTAALGPIKTTYTGTATFAERDELAHRMVVTARGREDRGSGSAQATVTASLHPDGDGTRVEVETDFVINGRAAQFGRSLLAEVSETMTAEFLRRLEELIAGRSSAAAGQPAPPELSVARTLAVPLARRAVGPALAALAVGFLLWLCARKRGQGDQGDH